MAKVDSGNVQRTYGPNNRSNADPFSALAAMIAEIVQYRSHIGTIFGADFKSTYRGTLLGVFWNFALPLVPISVYILLVSLKVFPRFEGLNAAVYISFNVTMWMLLTGMITRPIQVVRSRTQEAMKTSIPLTAAITSSFAQLCFDAVLRLVLVAVLVAAFGPVPNVHLPYLFLSLLTGLVFCLSLGLILSIFNMIYPDVERLTNIILQYGIFVSGVIFPINTLGPLAIIENYNPFNVFIKSARDFLFFGAHADTMTLLVWTGIAGVLALLAARFFYIMEHRIREAV